MVHKTTEFKAEEVDGCLEALHLCEAVDLIQVIENVSWRGVQIRGAKRGNQSPPQCHGVLFWVSVQVRYFSGRAAVFAKSASDSIFKAHIARPDHFGLFDMPDMVLGMIQLLLILALSKMDGNNDALYDPCRHA
jgi:hypothetical protein